MLPSCMGIQISHYKGINETPQGGKLLNWIVCCLILCIPVVCTCLLVQWEHKSGNAVQCIFDRDTNNTTEHAGDTRDEVMIGSTLFHAWHPFLLIHIIECN